jgi:hypothetical protein
MSNVTRVSPVQTAHINLGSNPASLGSNALVAAITGSRIRVLSAAIVTTLANNVKFLSAATDISATWPLGANGGLVLPFNEHGWCQTALGEALNMNLSVATATGVHIQYIVLGA